MKLTQLSACKLKEAYKKGETSPVEVCDALFKAYDGLNSQLNAFVHLDKEKILSQAKELEKEGPKGSLWGVPVTLKDNICTKDELTTCASKILKGFVPPYDATVVEKLRQEGAIIFGKANMDEFAFGSSTETSAYGVTRNPWDVERIPGGSSGGSACAVGAQLTPLALGSDTGGSIRQPASLCGVVGFKPTYGRISRYGLIAFASSLDQIGPFSRTIEDNALLYAAIAGKDKHDATSVDVEVGTHADFLKGDIKGLKIGIPKEYFVEGLEPEVEKAIKEALDTFKKLGAECVEITLPHTKYAVADYYIVAPAEASSNLARFDGVKYGHRTDDIASGDNGSLINMYMNTRREGFGAEAKRRIMLGTYVLSSGYYDAYYLRALKARSLIRADFEEAFSKCDCIMTPTSPSTAFKIGEKVDDPISMYLSDIFTISANLAGIPAISFNCGFDSLNLPIGMQILAKPFDEKTIFNAVYNFQSNTDFHLKSPDIVTQTEGK